MFTAGEIRQLDLGPQRPQTADFGEVSGAAVGGNLVAFGPGVTEQHRLDIIRSLLFAQLVAGGKAQRHTAPVEWYAAYQAALEKIAWVVRASTTTQRYLSPTPKFTVAALAGDVLRSRLSTTERATMTDLFTAYQSDAGGLAQVVFECPSHSGGLGNFQVALATEDEEGDGLVLRILRVICNVPKHVVRVMNEEFTSDASVQVGFVAMTLNEEVFSQLRSSLNKRLQSWLTTSVAPLHLVKGETIDFGLASGGG
jgi:hypothetical protein